MSTQTLTQQIHLVNIISISQDRLQSNFKSIVSKLHSQDKHIKAQNMQLSKMEQQLKETIKHNEQFRKQQISNINAKIQKCLEMIYELMNANKQQNICIQNNQHKIQNSKNQILQSICVMEERVNEIVQENGSIVNKISKVQIDVYKAYEEILKKQDSTQVLKICREVQGTKEKMQKNQKEYKMLEHKIEKIQIQHQKTERNQSKKQIELMRQIQDRIKKQLKGLHKNSQLSDIPPRFSNLSNQKQCNEESDYSGEGSSCLASTPREGIGMGYRKQSNIRLLKLHQNNQIDEQDRALNSIKVSMDKIQLSKMQQKLQAFESKIKTIQNSINLMNSNKKTIKLQNNEDIKQKINQIKPEMIKIWAKCDTLDDRIAFNQRKMQQKSKMLNILMESNKENNAGKMQQKLKNFQTEVYSIVKQLKTKLDSKVNLQDYEKYCMMQEDKLRQLSQIVFLKSDKLEVKKALLFLQSKIKQIILVISQDEENQKDALLTKKQLKCMSCDKDIDKVGKLASTSSRGNWDSMPYKEHSPQLLGKFGMTGFGSLSKKLKKLQSKELPVLRSKKNGNTTLQPIVNTIAEVDTPAQTS